MKDFMHRRDNLYNTGNDTFFLLLKFFQSYDEFNIQMQRPQVTLESSVRNRVSIEIACTPLEKNVKLNPKCHNKKRKQNP